MRLATRPRILATPRERWVSYIILAVTLALFALQLRSLYIVPVPDSVRWGGDETWLMREFGNQITHGAMAYPENFGAPTRTDGVLAGSMWVNALIYGLPGQLLSPQADLVDVGRTVTAILSITLALSLFAIQRRFGVRPILAASTVAVLVISQGFAWASHCARYDMLTGLALLGYIALLTVNASREHTRRGAFILGMLAALTIIFSRHLLTLALGPTLLFAFSQIRREKLFISYTLGAIAGFAVLSLAYYFGAGEFSLFGRGGGLGSYGFVLRQIPIMRPFSRNVQLSNLIERYNLFATDATGMLVLLLAVASVLIAFLIFRLRMKREGKTLRIARTAEQQFVIMAVALSLASWLLLQGSRPYYLIHIVPVLCLASAIVLELVSEVFDAKRMVRALPMLVLAIAVVSQAQRAIPATTFGSAVHLDQTSAIHELLAKATPKGSRVLCDVAGLHEALRDTAHQILTLDMFQPPSVAEAAVRKLRANKIEYVILRSSPVGEAFEPGRALLPHVLDSIGEPRDTALGFFYDDGRNYDATLSRVIDQGLDTLKLYQVAP